jgi:hypothetical protein
MPESKTDTTNGKNGSKPIGGVLTVDNAPTWLLVVGVLAYFGLIGPEAQKRDTEDALRFERLEAHAKLTNDKLTELNTRLEAQSAGFVTVSEFRLWQQVLGHLNPEMKLPDNRSR